MEVLKLRKINNNSVKTNEEITREFAKEYATSTKEFKDFHIIMADYHSGDPVRIQRAKDDACENLKQFIAYILSKNYTTYCAKDFEDMLQCGYIGVLKGLETYDPDKAKPTTYFKTFIKCEVSKYVTEYKNHTTVHYASVLNRITKAANYFESVGIPYNNVKLAEFCNISLVSVNEALAYKEKSVTANYQDALLNKADVDNPIVGDPHRYNPEDEYMHNEQTDMIQLALKQCLDKQEQFVVMARFGFLGNTMSHSEVAKALHITVQESKTLQQRALNKLRGSFLNRMYNDKYQKPWWLSDTFEFFPEKDDKEDEFTFVNALAEAIEMCDTEQDTTTKKAI